tara:strand:- start:3659 stop:5377 length:1719 start_codon:yes stop_codon:yes gene_type:complete
MVVRPSSLSGEYVILSQIGVPNEGFTASSWESVSSIGRDKIIDAVIGYRPVVDLSNERIISRLQPPGRPFVNKIDSYSVADWDKSRSSQLNTQTSYFPASLYGGSSLSPLNIEIMFNDEIVPVNGVSSTIKVHFSKRSAGVTQYQYIISSLNTSSYLLGRADTGQSLNLNERWWTNVYTGIELPTVNPNAWASGQATSGTQYNPTKGGALTKNDSRLIYDTELMFSIPIYRDYFNSGIEYTFDAAVKPFDFVSFSGETATTTNEDKGGDYTHPILSKNAIMYERLIFNLSGQEGICYHQHWNYFPKVPSGTPQNNMFFYGIGPYFTNIFNKAYIYNTTLSSLHDLDSDSFTGGSPTTGTYSATVSALFSASLYTVINERTDYPNATQWALAITKNRTPFRTQTPGAEVPIFYRNDQTNTLFPSRYGGLILDKNTGSWSSSSTSTYTASGPLAVGMYWKMASATNNQHINGFSGEFNYFNFGMSHVSSTQIHSEFEYGPSQNIGTQITLGGYEYYLRVPGWVGHQYWFVFGKDKDEVKLKLQYLHDRRVADNGTPFTVPRAVANSVVPIRPYG